MKKRKIVIRKIRFGIASSGYSNVWIGANSDNNEQNRQSAMLDCNKNFYDTFFSRNMKTNS